MTLDAKVLKRARPDEMKWGETTIGPHRDDLVFIINGHPLKGYASEGEERTAVIALKLAEAEMLYNKTGKQPILLLDEVAAELDQHRKQLLLNSITRLYNGRKGQIFYTSTRLPDFSDAGRFRRFIVKEGTVEVS